MLMSAAFMFSALVQFALGLVVAFLLGPAQFGVYALGIAAAVLGQTLGFEWIRLAITRFHDGREGEGLRQRLDRVMLWLMLVCGMLSAMFYGFGGQSRLVLALLPVVTFAAGFAEYRSAFLRAMLDQRGFVAMTMARNLAAIILMPLAAIYIGTAEATFGAYALALMLGTMLGGGKTRLLPESNPAAETSSAMATPYRMRDLFAYSGPIIFTNLAYLGLFFAMRAYLALVYGVAEAGQFSLALEFGLKLVMTLGSALDLFLFQLAVRESREGGAVEARLRSNAAIILALLAPLCLGIWLILPSIATLIIAPAFREAFAGYLAALLPGLFLYGVIQYVLHPFVQIAGRTIRLLSAGLAALVVAILMLELGSKPLLSAYLSLDARHIIAGLATFAGMLVATMLLAVRIGATVRFGMMPLAKLIAPCIAMVGACLFLRAWPPGILTLCGTAFSGMVIYCVLAYAFDLAGLRTRLWARR